MKRTLQNPIRQRKFQLKKHLLPPVELERIRWLQSIRIKCIQDVEDTLESEEEDHSVNFKGVLRTGDQESAVVSLIFRAI